MPHLLAIGGVFAAGQLLESLVLTPLLVGDRLGLHPVAVIFAVMAGGQLFGFFGVLLALPVSAVLLVLLRRGAKPLPGQRLVRAGTAVLTGQQPLALRLRADQTFDSFISPPGTAAARARQLAQSLASGRERTPLYLWGPPACGKTHLLTAALAVAATHGLRSAYLPLRELGAAGVPRR